MKHDEARINLWLNLILSGEAIFLIALGSSQEPPVNYINFFSAGAAWIISWLQAIAIYDQVKP